MNHRRLRNHCCFVVTFVLLAFGVQFSNAANIPVSGSYEVIEKTDVGSQTKILLRLHLTNHGQELVSLQNVLLWDFAHPPSAGPRSSSITLHPGTSEDTTQEFVIPRLQFDEWQRGLRPRVILQLRTATGARITEAIRLDRVAPRKSE